jgi:hypothetical protein
MRKRVYPGEACEGMVTANFFVEDEKVEGYFCDGDISSNGTNWYIEKTGKNEYRIIETDQLHTSLDDSLGKNSPGTKHKKFKAKTKREALVAMIDFIVKLYINPGEYSMPVNAKKLKRGLEKALIS